MFSNDLTPLYSEVVIGLTCTGIKGRRKSRSVVSVVISQPAPTKAGPNAPQCPNCKVITARTENSIVNSMYDQFFDCDCGTRVTVPRIRVVQ